MIKSTISTLRPGLLVSFKTSVSGNVDYRKQEIEPDHKTEAGNRRAVWQTERVITDPEEHERATKTRSKCLSLVASVCARSAFGLLCAEIDRDKLDKAIAEARRLADEFNESATLTAVRVYIIIGRVAADDVYRAYWKANYGVDAKPCQHRDDGRGRCIDCGVHI